MKHQLLYELGACSEAVAYAEQFDTLQSAWDECKRGEWMLWLISRTTNRNDESQLRKITLAKARCAKLVIHLMKDERSRKAVEVAEQYGLGNKSRNELDAAYAAAYAAADAYAYSYAYAAAYARQKTLKQCAEIVRELYSSVPKQEVTP